LPRKATLLALLLLSLALCVGYLSLRREAPALNPRLEAVVEVRDEYYQGLAYYNGYWYFSDREYLAKAREPGVGRPDLENDLPIPYDLVLERYNHIGDIDVEGGKVYAPLEDVDYAKPVIAVYDAETLKFLAVIGPLPQRHLPWCAVDLGKGLIYASEFSDVDRIFVYNLKGRKVGEIALNTTLQRVQGGDIEGGYLYLTTDDGGDWVYRVDLRTGDVVRVVRVDTPHEMEGVEVHEGKLYALVGTRRGVRNLLFVYELYSAASP